MGLLVSGCVSTVTNSAYKGGPPAGDWVLVFEENFDGSDKELEAGWRIFDRQRSAWSGLCVRMRKNAVLKDGILNMLARKEKQDGREWTTAGLLTREKFQYGYFECRYRYAAATGTNNAFWIMDFDPVQDKPKFEIDINEGHYPYEVNMNLHRYKWQDLEHKTWGGRWYYYGAGEDEVSPEQAGFQIPLSSPIQTSKIRLVSDSVDIARIVDLRVFPPSNEGYPSVFPSLVEAQPDVPNLAGEARAEATSVLVGRPECTPDKAIDGNLDSRWLSDRDDKAPALTLTFDSPKTIGCLQFVSGWKDPEGRWVGIINDFYFEYWNGTDWVKIPGASRKAVDARRALDRPRDPNAPPDLGHSFHVYGLEWNEKELIYYFDGREIRRIGNEICHAPASVALFLAVGRFAGRITDAIDGTSMDVDWVRVWKKKPVTKN